MSKTLEVDNTQATGRKIPEIQRFKEKYPQYKEYDDGALLSRIAQKFPKAYGHLADREFGTISKPATLPEIAVEGYKRGKLGIHRGELGTAVKEGRLSIEDAKKSVQASQEKLRTSAHKSGAFTLPARMVKGTAELLPFILKGAAEALKQGSAGAVAGGTAALAGGQAGPQVLAPEEALTVPAGITGGFAVGATFGIINTTRRIEGGNSYLDMIDQGVDSKIALPISEVVGTVNGIIEVSQLSLLAKSLPGGSILFKKKIRDAVSKNPVLLKKFMEIGKQLAGDIASETGQEVAQEGTSIAGEALAGVLETVFKGKEYKGPKAEDIRKRMFGVLKSSAEGFPLLMLPGSAVQSVNALADANAVRMAKIIEVTAEEMKEAEKGNVSKELKEKVKGAEAVVVTEDKVARKKAVEDLKALGVKTPVQLNKAQKELKKKMLAKEKAKQASVVNSKIEIMKEAKPKTTRKQQLQWIKNAAKRKKKSGTFSTPKQVKTKAPIAPKAVEEKPIQMLHEVVVNTPQGEITKNLSTKQLTNLKESIRNKEVGGLSIVSEKSILSNEKGFVDIFAMMEKITGFKSNLVAKMDVEDPFKRIGAAKTGLSLKQFASRAAAAQEKGLQAVAELGKFGASVKDFTRAAFASENIESIDAADAGRLKPMLDYIRSVFDSYYEELKALKPETFKDTFPESLIKRLEVELEELKVSLKAATTRESRKAIAERSREVYKQLKYFKENDIKYVHIPLKLWFAEKFKDRSDFGSLMGRKSPSLATFVELGYIKPEDIDIRDILANYIRYVETQKALINITQKAKLEGVAAPKGTKGTENWVAPPTKVAALLKGYVVHSTFAQNIEEYFGSFHGANLMSQVLGSVKMMQFYNPLRIAINDIVQSVMAGTLRSNLPKHMWQAFKDMTEKGDRYWALYDFGIFSTPFANPFSSFAKRLQEIKQSENNGSIMLRSLGKTKEYVKNPVKMLQDIYNTSWNISWTMDHFFRLVTANAMMAKGLSMEEAAQTTAKFLGDYASVPPATRKVLNKIFFTPTFEIVMNKLYVEMLTQAATHPINMVRDKGGVYKASPIAKSNERFAKGLLYMAAIVIGKNQYMTKGLKMKQEEFSRKYSLTVDTDFGPKDVTVVTADPSNLWFRYFHGLKPEELSRNRYSKAARFLKNKLNPVWRILDTFITAGINNEPPKDEAGNFISNPFDPLYKQFKDEGLYILSRTVRLTETIVDSDVSKLQKKQAFKALVEGVGIVNTLAIKGVAFSYMRKTKDERDVNKIKFFSQEFGRISKIDVEKIAPEKIDEAIDIYEKRMMNFINKQEAFIEKMD